MDKLFPRSIDVIGQYFLASAYFNAQNDEDLSTFSLNTPLKP